MSLPQIILTDLPHISFLFYNYYPLLKFKRSLRTNLLFSQSHWFSFNFYKTALLCVDFFQCFKHMSRFWAYSHFTLNPLQYTLTPRRQMIIVSRVFSSDLESTDRCWAAAVHILSFKPIYWILVTDG